MIRCTYRLTSTHGIISTAKCDQLPQKGDVVTLNQVNYIIESVTQEGPMASITVHLQNRIAKQISNNN